MTWIIWKNALGRAPASYPKRRRRMPLSERRFRPLVEVFEDRTLPSTFLVTDLGDKGVGSGLEGDLRYAINTANSNAEPSNSIVFQPGLSGTITLMLGELAVTKDLDITGPGADALTISGNHQSGVFDIPNDPRVQNVRLSDLSISDGTGVPFGSGPKGGALFNFHATVILTRVTVSRNSVGDVLGHAGGGIENIFGTVVLNSSTVSANHAAIGGGIDNTGTMILNDSLVADNTSNDVAGINNRRIMTLHHCTVSGNSARLIGGIDNLGTLTVADSAIADNVALSIGGLNNNGGWVALSNSMVTRNSGGAIANTGSMTISGSTIADNTGRGVFGGIRHGGSYDLNITNSTISNNTAGDGVGGIYVEGARPQAAPTVELTSTTITLNTALGPRGFGGMAVARSVEGRAARVWVRNTIVAGNVSVGGRPDVFGTVLSLGYNLVGQGDDSAGWLDTDQTGTASRPLNPRLAPLRDNGGPTTTHGLLADSPAIDRGDPGLGSTSDQRGTLRLLFGGRAPDVGAFEADLARSFRVVGPMQVAPGQPFNVTVIALDRWGNTASTYTRSARFSSSDSDAVLPEDYTFSADDGGQQVFAVTLQTPGRQTLTVADPENPLVRGEVTVDVTDGSAFSGTSRYFCAFLSWEIDGTSDHPRRV